MLPDLQKSINLKVLKPDTCLVPRKSEYPQPSNDQATVLFLSNEPRFPKQ